MRGRERVRPARVAVRPVRELVPLLACYAALLATELWPIADPITGARRGHAWARTGAGAFTACGTAWFATVLERLLRIPAVNPLPSVLIFLSVTLSTGLLSLNSAPDLRPVRDAGRGRDSAQVSTSEATWSAHPQRHALWD